MKSQPAKCYQPATVPNEVLCPPYVCYETVETSANTVLIKAISRARQDVDGHAYYLYNRKQGMRSDVLIIVSIQSYRGCDVLPRCFMLNLLAEH